LPAVAAQKKRAKKAKKSSQDTEEKNWSKTEPPPGWHGLKENVWGERI